MRHIVFNTLYFLSKYSPFWYRVVGHGFYRDSKEVYFEVKILRLFWFELMFKTDCTQKVLDYRERRSY